MDNTFEHLHQHYEGHNHLHHQMDQMLPTDGGGGGSTPSSPMIGYDQGPHMQHHGDQNQHGDQGAMSMMKMYFHFGLGDMVLFPNLVMDSHTKLWLTCAVLFLAAILLEMIDYSRGYLSCRCQAQANGVSGGGGRGGGQRRGKSSTSSDTILVDDGAASGRAPSPSARHRRQWNCCAGSAPGLAPEALTNSGQEQGYGTWRKEYFEPTFFPVYSNEPHCYRLLQASLQFVRTGLSLCLMLVAMSYNVCLIFAILLGSATGYYIFYRPALDSKSVVCH